jgi:hypothetical protein
MRLIVAAALALAAMDALEVQITEADLKRAIALARGDSRALEAFHRPYVIPVTRGDLQTIEVVTELRRAVLSAAGGSRVGEPEAAVVRRLQQALAPHRGRVSVVAHFRFSPQTAYVTLPQYALTIPAAPGGPEVRPLDVRRTPIYQGGGGNTYLAGADVEAVFDGLQVGQTRRPVAVILEGKELAAVSIEFASLR